MSIHRVRAVLHLEPHNIPRLLARAKAMYAAVFANQGLFANPDPTLAALLVLINTLQDAQDAMSEGGDTAGDVREAARKALVLGLQALQRYVQGLCDVTTPEKALLLIAGSGMYEAADSAHHKDTVAGESGVQPGTMAVSGNAGLLTVGAGSAAVCYHWRTRPVPVSPVGGPVVANTAPWTLAMSTPVAHTLITGLAPTTNYELAASVTIGEGLPGPWTDAVIVSVH